MGAFRGHRFLGAGHTVVTGKMRLPHTHPPLNAFKNDQDSWPEKKKPIIG